MEAGRTGYHQLPTMSTSPLAEVDYVLIEVGSAGFYSLHFILQWMSTSWDIPYKHSFALVYADSEYWSLKEPGTASFWQTVFNSVNILCGVGLLATPYAAACSGWGSLSFLILTGA